MKSEILTYIAIATGLLGVILSILTFYRKKKAEQNFETLLKKNKSQLETIKSIGTVGNETAHINRVLSFEEFVKVQESFKVLLARLEEKDRQEILESLEQKSLKGQVDYLNKLIHLGGSTEYIVIMNERSEAHQPNTFK
jgi:ABC-type bacteriocin/lantibiotic exporter with double-glycine peptidase domain